jgi:A/G-specific adenine glycosylase
MTQMLRIDTDKSIHRNPCLRRAGAKFPPDPWLNTKHRSTIKARVLGWYKKNARALPWRGERDPYRVLLSEVMLQQTQVARVLLKYPEFLGKYPSLSRLAQASPSAVIKAWRGMGYNNRALRLHELARRVVTDFAGKVPSGVADLMRLPGIGPYTAHAVACFAFGQRLPVVDTNISRIFRRLYPGYGKVLRRQEPDFWPLAAAHLPRLNSHDWNQALMDLGATICTSAAPRCGVCPLQKLCPSAHRREPRKAKRASTEPNRNGIPNRIFRGKAIEVLRDLKAGESIRTSLLAKKIKIDFSGADRRWFDFLIKGLERDGLVSLRGKTRISLPA